MSARMWAMAACLLAAAPGVAWASDGGFTGTPEGAEEAADAGVFIGAAVDGGTPPTGTAGAAVTSSAESESGDNPDAGSGREASAEADLDALAADAAAKAAAAEAAAAEAAAKLAEAEAAAAEAAANAAAARAAAAEAAAAEAAKEQAAREALKREAEAAREAAKREEAQRESARRDAARREAAERAAQPEQQTLRPRRFRGGRSVELVCKDTPEMTVDYTLRRGPVGLAAALALGGGLSTGAWDGVAQAEGGIRFLDGRFYGIFGGSTQRANFHYGFGADWGYGYRSLDGLLFRGGAAVLFPMGAEERVYDFYAGAGLVGLESATSLMLHARTDATFLLALQVDYFGQTRLENQRRLAAADPMSPEWKYSLIASGVAALLGGLALDVLPGSANNAQLDPGDFAPPVLYAGGLTALFVALRQ